VFAAVGGGALIRDLPYLYVALCAGATVAIAWLYGAKDKGQRMVRTEDRRQRTKDG